MSSMLTHFDYVIYVDSEQWAVCRHVLTRIIRSTSSNVVYVDMFWLSHLCRQQPICCMSTRFDYVIYVDMKNFGNYKTTKTTTKSQSWELTNRLLLIHSKVYIVLKQLVSGKGYSCYCSYQSFVNILFCEHTMTLYFKVDIILWTY